MSLTSSGNYPDDYKVYIAPAVTGVTPTVAYFEENGNLLISVAPENWSAGVGRPGAGLASQSINLRSKVTTDAPSGWFNRNVWIAFVNTTDRYTNPTTGIPNTTAGGSNLAVDNIKVVNNILTGVEDQLQNTFSANVYPNPATNEVNISFNMQGAEMVSVSIVDVTGREVLNLNKNINSGSNKLRIDVSGLERGVYVMRTNIGNKLNVSKLLIQN